MKNLFNTSLLSLSLFMMFSCMSDKPNSQESAKIPVIFDTDANNELDDQHALAYLFLNEDLFDIKAITVNATYNGGEAGEHYKEAERVMKLTNSDHYPLLTGANGSFEEIKDNIGDPDYDGAEAVDFIIETIHNTEDELTLIAVGKLTNVALAVKKDPSVAEKVRLVWLGSNYPEPGEYNQDNDTAAMNYLLNSRIPFEMVTVRYGKPTGTDAVRATKEEILQKMPGTGPAAEQAVTGRHGGRFTNFGDYSANLFEHIHYHGDPPSRALFDMAAIAIIKNPDWAERKTIPAPVLINGEWKERHENDRKIVLWENFDSDKIMADFYATIERATPEEGK